MNNFENLKITVVGTGYVGLSMATLLAQHHEVLAVDVVPGEAYTVRRKILQLEFVV